MSARHPLLLACALLPWWGLGAAQAIYKSVDAQGNVTYSSTPPPGGAPAQPVTIPGEAKARSPGAAVPQPQPSEQQSGLRQKQRKEQQEQQAKAVKDAEDQLSRAKKDLEIASRPKAKVERSSERIPETDGQTANRTAKEQRAVREAERALREAKRGKLPPKEAE